MTKLKTEEMAKEGAAVTGDEMHIPETLPLLPLKDIVTFPFMIVPLFVTRNKSVAAIEQALQGDRMVFLSAQKDPAIEDPKAEDIHSVGTVGVIMRMLKLPDERLRVLVQGLTRARLAGCRVESEYFQARIAPIIEPSSGQDLETEALVRTLKSNMQTASQLGKNVTPETLVVLQSLEDPGRLSDLAAANLQLSVAEAQSVLETLHPLERLRKINEILARELELLTVQQRISSQAKDQIEKSQKEYFLRQQLKAIRLELGEGNELAEEIEAYRTQLREAKLSPEAHDEAHRQINRLERMYPDSAEAATVRNYLDWLFSLPWSVHTSDNLDLKKARRILDRDHYDLQEIKDRIIEFLAVLRLKNDLKGPILKGPCSPSATW